MASFKWYINRAKLMNTKEILHRIKCKKYDKKIESGYRLKEERYNVNFIKLPKFYGGNENEDSLLLNNAENILNNYIEVFNIRINLNYEKKFSIDPFTKEVWSREIYTKVSFRKANLPGDPKIIWEINKQQYLLDLALAYQLTGNKKYANKIISEINEWIIQNPEYMGINWTSGLEISLRCITWMFSLSLIKDYINANNICINKIAHYIRIKTEFIFNKLSLYSSANNHLIGEITLLLYSSYFLECKEVNVWRNYAINMINKQIKNQFYSDGINKEQSINYQIHTMELYFLCEYILNTNGIKLNNDTLEILKKACFYLDKLSENDGTVFNIGDEDGGHILKLQNHPANILDILQFGSLVLKDTKIYGQKNKEIDYKIQMLFGENYVNFTNISNKVRSYKESSNVFKDGGMFIKDGIINGMHFKVMFDFGPIGMVPLNAHAHSDILSFNMNIDGKPFLVDCGTYKYHKDKGFRDYFRGVKAHNTISIDGLNQFEFLGPFMCSKSPVSKIDLLENNIIKCSTNMFKNVKGTVSREIRFLENYIEIIDRITNHSLEYRQVQIYFNIDSKINVQQVENCFLCKIESNCICVQVDSKCETKIESGYENKQGEKLGWQSNEYYKLDKNNMIICTSKLNPKHFTEIITKIFIKG